MKEVILLPSMVESIGKIYDELGKLYDETASKIRFSCNGCSDNCCDSYFQHHTYLEWAYLHIGFNELTEEKQLVLIQRSKEYQTQCAEAIEKQERPQVMCPLNEDGLCILYKHRLLVCRTHGVPATFTKPDGQSLYFPGCFRCQKMVKKKYMHESQAPMVERTPFLQGLAVLENELLENRRQDFPRVQKTIADMLVEGPPLLDI